MKIFRSQSAEEYFRSQGRRDYMALARGELALEQFHWKIEFDPKTNSVCIKNSADKEIGSHLLDSNKKWHSQRRLIKAEIAAYALQCLGD